MTVCGELPSWPFCMPTPTENETREEFVERCIPIVIDDGTAEDGVQAAAVCNSLWEQEKSTGVEEEKLHTDDEDEGSSYNSVSYEDVTAALDRAFREQFPSADNMFSWVVEVFDDSIISEFNGNFYRVPYDLEVEDGVIESVEFADVIRWHRVQERSEWVDKRKQYEAAEFDVDACPKKMVKVIKDEGDALHIGAYATIWGELDCDGERMTKEALMPYVESGATPLMFWLHGWDEDFGSTMPGSWNGGSFLADDVGLWVEGTVTHPEAIRRIKESGEVGLSVGSNPKFVNVDDDGNILDWALLEISVMEGGKQCVPSAYTDMKSEHEALLIGKAREYGLEDDTPQAEPAGKLYRIGGELVRIT